MVFPTVNNLVVIVIFEVRLLIETLLSFSRSLLFVFFVTKMLITEFFSQTAC